MTNCHRNRLVLLFINTKCDNILWWYNEHGHFTIFEPFLSVNIFVKIRKIILKKHEYFMIYMWQPVWWRFLLCGDSPVCYWLILQFHIDIPNKKFNCNYNKNYWNNCIIIDTITQKNHYITWYIILRTPFQIGLKSSVSLYNHVEVLQILYNK